MITKINTITSLNRSYNNYSNTSFKSYTTTFKNIGIYTKNIHSPVSSMSGNIDIDNSVVNGNSSTMSGDVKINYSNINGNSSTMSGYIDINNSNIKGNVSNESGNIAITDSIIKGNITDISGDIEINKCSTRGNIDNTRGSIALKKSTLTGNAANTSGTILIKNSIIDGTIFSKPENLQLQGRNRIKELVLRGFKKADVEYVNNFMKKFAKKGISITSLASNTNIYINGTVINKNSSQDELAEKPLVYKLPKGNIISTIKFDTDQKGILILEDDTEFFGKVINGVIKRQNGNHPITTTTEKVLELVEPEHTHKVSDTVKKETTLPTDTSNKTVRTSKPKKTARLEKQSDEILRDSVLIKEKEPEISLFSIKDISLERDATDLPSKRLKNKSTFRDEELFDESIDILTSPKYLQYSVDDIPLNNNIWMRYSKAIDRYNHMNIEYPQTDLSLEEKMMLDKVLHYPKEISYKERMNIAKLKVFMQKALEQIREITTDYQMPHKIFKNCTVLRNGENQQDIHLCKLALKLFINSNKWDKVEEQILDEVRIPIWGKIYGAISSIKYNKAFVGLLKECTNQEILKCLKKISPLDIYKLRGII